MIRKGTAALFAAIAVALACAGCARRVTSGTSHTAQDSVTIVQARTGSRQETSRTAHTDSVTHGRVDSVYIIDSTHVTEHADGSVEVYRFRDRYHGRTLTETRKSSGERTDSVSTSSSDTLEHRASSAVSTKSHKSTRTRGGLGNLILLLAALAAIAIVSVLATRRLKERR